MWQGIFVCDFVLDFRCFFIVLYSNFYDNLVDIQKQITVFAKKKISTLIKARN